ncbi:MAG TPA: TrmH family RNA methyltransferase [Crocinitomicaceae bacterium]|nr:TrmH family RNA methyltransferase [Crocinitomicaceae bacterium]
MSIDEKVLAEFYNIITESKQDKYDQIASERTKYLTVVMESISKEHNSSAVMRTCDCFGIQDLHTIEKGQKKHEPMRDIALGAGNWVDLHTYDSGDNSSIECLKKLKNQGYKIVATTPHTDIDINDIDIDQPIALIFGTERTGISKEVEEMADELVKIPMYGFTESFNISVSAAVALNILRNKLEHSNTEWKLTKDEQVKLKIQWSKKIIRDGEKVEKEIRRRISKNKL